MRSFRHPAGLLLVLFGLGVLACAAAVLCGRREGEGSDPATVLAQRRELDQQSAEVQARIELRQCLISELIEGRSSLSEVTDEFLRLNRQDPKTVAEIRHMYPATDERESTARQVLSWTEESLKWRRDLTPEARLRVLARLEAELRQMCQ